MEFSLEHLQPKERASFALRSLYETAGCRKYHMGRFEEYSLYQENRSFLSSEQVITFTDLDGRLLALKPDVTLSIAKTAQPAPGETLRYYYHENVYRPSAESHTFKEISQMGLELLGAVGEAEVQHSNAARQPISTWYNLVPAWLPSNRPNRQDARIQVLPTDDMPSEYLSMYPFYPIFTAASWQNCLRIMHIQIIIFRQIYRSHH